MSKIFVLGYFGLNTNQLDGQTIKTRDIYRLACEQQDNVSYYDTEDFKYNKFSILKMFWNIIICKTLIYLPAHNNLKVIFPIIFLISKLFRVRIHYFVVGGWLSEYISSLWMHRLMLKKISGVHVETHKLKNELMHEYQFMNVDIFPNFRYFDTTFKPKVTTRVDQLKVVFVSRVEQSKGLDTLVNVANVIEQQHLNTSITFDFYGQLRDDYYQRFMTSYKCFTYKGVLQPDEVMSTLRKYDVLIFPTHYSGEGCPGILVEAMAVGLPIVASDWKYNNEFVRDGLNGFLCEVYNHNSYFMALTELQKNPKLRDEMSVNSLKMSKYFSAEYAKDLMKLIIG